MSCDEIRLLFFLHKEVIKGKLRLDADKKHKDRMFKYSIERNSTSRVFMFKVSLRSFLFALIVIYVA